VLVVAYTKSTYAFTFPFLIRFKD